MVRNLRNSCPAKGGDSADNFFLTFPQFDAIIELGQGKKEKVLFKAKLRYK